MSQTSGMVVTNATGPSNSRRSPGTVGTSRGGVSRFAACARNWQTMTQRGEDGELQFVAVREQKTIPTAWNTEGPPKKCCREMFRRSNALWHPAVPILARRGGGHPQVLIKEVRSSIFVCACAYTLTTESRMEECVIRRKWTILYMLQV